MFDATRESFLFASVQIALLCGVAFAAGAVGHDCRCLEFRPNGVGDNAVEEDAGKEGANRAQPPSCSSINLLNLLVSRSSRRSCARHRPVSVIAPPAENSATCFQDSNPSGIAIRPNGQCARGWFLLEGMVECHPWLTCEDYAFGDLVLGPRIGSGAVKQVFLASWRGHAVAVSTPSTSVDGVEVYPDDFRQGLSMHLLLQPSGHLVTFVGHCEDDAQIIIITEYHRHGNANNLEVAVSQESASAVDDDEVLKIRFRFCLDYAAIVRWLHGNGSKSGGTRVMCDSSSLQKTLEQYLITDDLRLVLNDVDALPRVDKKRPIVCGHRQLGGTFVAPEQRWPHDRAYDETEMPGYDEKSDIWKIPDVCEFFLGAATNREIVLYRLFKLHGRCKSPVPDRRPTASEVLRAYQNIWDELFSTF